MTDRDNVFKVSLRGHDDRISRACQTIADSDTTDMARLNLEIAVRCLPVVSGSPDTVTDILKLMDTFIVRLTTVPERADRCWVEGVHLRHWWTDVDGTFSCPGVSVTA